MSRIFDNICLWQIFFFTPLCAWLSIKEAIKSLRSFADQRNFFRVLGAFLKFSKDSFQILSSSRNFSELFIIFLKTFSEFLNISEIACCTKKIWGIFFCVTFELRKIYRFTENFTASTKNVVKKIFERCHSKTFYKIYPKKIILEKWHLLRGWHLVFRTLPHMPSLQSPNPTKPPWLKNRLTFPEK